MIGVFIDTFVILNLTALVIITTQSIPTGLQVQRSASMHFRVYSEIR